MVVLIAPERGWPKPCNERGYWHRYVQTDDGVRCRHCGELSPAEIRRQLFARLPKLPKARKPRPKRKPRPRPKPKPRPRKRGSKPKPRPKPRTPVKLPPVNRATDRRCVPNGGRKPRNHELEVKISVACSMEARDLLIELGAGNLSAGFRRLVAESQLQAVIQMRAKQERERAAKEAEEIVI